MVRYLKPGGSSRNARFGVPTSMIGKPRPSVMAWIYLTGSPRSRRVLIAACSEVAPRVTLRLSPYLPPHSWQPTPTLLTAFVRHRIALTVQGDRIAVQSRLMEQFS